MPLSMLRRQLHRSPQRDPGPHTASGAATWRRTASSWPAALTVTVPGALLIFKTADEATPTRSSQDPYAAVDVIAGIRITEWSPVIGMFAGLAA